MKVWNQYFIAPAVIKDACYIIFLHNKGVILGKHTDFSSSNAIRTTYDVFVNFCGKDTRNNFIGFLFQVLRRNGTDAFKDNADLKTSNRNNKGIWWLRCEKLSMRKEFGETSTFRQVGRRENEYMCYDNVEHLEGKKYNALGAGRGDLVSGGEVHR
ncbi:hypothetical protein JHK87_053038 [Glycine soja]|nr:hypothetical protein JHK87_053038 [Glycine soja]